MGAHKLHEMRQLRVQLEVARSLNIINEQQSYFEQLQRSYEALVGVTVWRHECLDAVIYVQNAGQHGFKAIKFYNDGIDFRVGSFQESEAQALHEGVNTL